MNTKWAILITIGFLLVGTSGVLQFTHIISQRDALILTVVSIVYFISCTSVLIMSKGKKDDKKKM
jgi:hypothetical protein